MVGGDSTTMLWEDSDTSSCSGTGSSSCITDAEPVSNFVSNYTPTWLWTWTLSVLVNAAVSASSSLALVGGDRHNTDKITNLSLDNLYSIQEIMSRGDMVMVATINVSMLEIQPVLKHT